MQTESQIRHKLQQVVFRHYQKKCKQAFKVLPTNCKHNIVLMDEGKPLNNPEIRLCGGPCKGQVCTTPEHASLCPLFEYAKSKNELRDEVAALVRRPVGEVAAIMPDVAALRWVLDDGEPPPDVVIPEDVAVPVATKTATVKKKWWQRWFK